MCSFATHSNMDFTIAMLRFVSAQAGLLAPHPDSPFTRDAMASSAAAREPAGVASPAGTFNLEACWTMVPALDLPERVVEIAR